MSTRLEVVYYDVDQVAQYSGQPADTAVGVALSDSDLALSAPLRPELAALPVSAVDVVWLAVTQLPEGSQIFLPNGASRLVEQTLVAPRDGTAVAERPQAITEGDATRIAYDSYIREAASFLRAGLSVLISCDKIVVPHLARHIVLLSGQEPQVLNVPSSPGSRPTRRRTCAS